MFDEYEDLISVEDACEALRAGRNTLYALLNSGELKGFRCGRIWKIPKAALREFVVRRSGVGR